ncbi:ABC transporter permease [Acuticoccus sediminis]|uniref:ABC transporter permease n=1 Tax=Acuticoccus sediminis TaxID=2184697 RepID=UPI001CFC59ED|nr:ABC transporter permease [Acuticoccus sediminis]
MNARSLMLNAYVYAVLAFIIVPILVILPMAFSEPAYLTFPPEGFTLNWFAEFFGNRRWMRAAQFSLTIALFVSLTTSIIGTMATYALVRGAGGIGALFQALLIGPIVVPHIALAVALYLFFGQVGLSGTTIGYVMAHSVIAMPFTVFTVAAALTRVDPALEDAAMSCGATRFTAFRLVTLPMILPNVLSGALFAFIISFDEPVISFFLAGIRDKTLPRMMFDNIEQNLTPVIPAIAVLLTLLSVAVLLLAALLRRWSAHAAAARAE